MTLSKQQVDDLVKRNVSFGALQRAGFSQAEQKQVRQAIDRLPTSDRRKNAQARARFERDRKRVVRQSKGTKSKLIDKKIATDIQVAKVTKVVGGLAKKTATETAKKFKSREANKQIQSKVKRKIGDILPKKLYTQAFTPDESRLIQNAKDPRQAIEQINKLKENQRKAERQKLESFLKVSFKAKNLQRLEQKEYNSIIKLIEKQEKNIKSAESKILKNKSGVLKNSFKDLRTELTDFIISSGKKGLNFKINPRARAEFGSKVGVELLKITYNLGETVVKANNKAFNYGRNLVNRGLWSVNNNPLKNDISKLAKFVTVTTTGAVKGTTEIAKFVKNNPSEAAAIVGIASTTTAGKGLKFTKNNPEKVVAEAIFILAPIKVPKVPNVTKTISKFNSSLKSSAIRTKAQLNKKIAQVKVDYAIYKKNKDRIVKGNLLKGKDKEEVLNKFKSFEKKNNIPSATAKLSDSQATKLLGFDKIEITPIKVANIKPSKVTPEILRSDLTKKLNSIANDPKALKVLLKSINQLGFKIQVTKLKQPIIQVSGKNAFLRKIEYKVVVGKNIKTRTKLSRKSKIRLAREEERILKKAKVKVKGNKTTKKDIGDFDVKGRTEFWNQQFKKADIANDLKPLFTAKKFNKKGQLNNIFASSVKKETITKVKKIKVKKVKRRNNFKANRRGHKTKTSKSNDKRKTAKTTLKDTLKEYNKNIKEIEIQKRQLERYLKDLQKINSIIRSNNSLATEAVVKALLSSIRLIKQEIRLLDVEVKSFELGIKQTVEQAKKLDQATVQDKDVSFKFDTSFKFENAPVNINVKKRPDPRPRPDPKPRPKPSPKPPTKPKTPRVPKIPKLRLGTTNLPKKGSRDGYIIQIKEGNKIVLRSDVLLPKNRATNAMRRFIDKTARASGQIVKKGKTTIVDVKKTVLASKFRPKKSKNPLVRREVEKRKFRNDKKNELKRKR